MNRDNDKGKILIGRTLVWVGVQFAMLLLIIVRLYYLQVYQADKFSTMADENRISTRVADSAAGRNRRPQRGKNSGRQPAEFSGDDRGRTDNQH